MAEAAATAQPMGSAGRGGRARLRRLVLAFAGEGSQSALHLAANLLLMRSLPTAEYGLFAIVFTLGSLAVSYASALVATPAAVFLPRWRSPGAADFQDVVLGTAGTALALLFGALVGAGLLAAGTGGAVSTAGAALAALWSLRACCRAALFARRRAEAAARSDGVFAAAGFVGLSAVLAVPPEGERLAAALAVLAAANAAGIAAALAAYPRRVRISLRPAVLRRYRAIAGPLAWSLVGVTTTNLQAQFQTFLVALVAGPAAFAPIAAALVVVAPLRLAGQAVLLMAQPEFAAALAAGRRAEAGRLLRRCYVVVVGACLAYGVGLVAAFDLLRRHVFGPGFAGEPMGLITALAWAISLLYLGYNLPRALLEAGGRFRAVAEGTLASAGLGIVLVSALLFAAGAAWSLAGVVAAEIVTLVLFWTGASRLLRGPAPPSTNGR